MDGHRISRNRNTPGSNGGVIFVDDGATLTLLGSSGTGQITGGFTTDDGGGIIVGQSATLNINRVNITNCTAYGSGSAIFIREGGNASVSDSRITR